MIFPLQLRCILQHHQNSVIIKQNDKIYQDRRWLNSQEIGICIFAILQCHCSNRKMATGRHVINITLNIHLDCK